jgi:hypothetical protein
MKRIFTSVAVALAAILVGAYATDYLVLRYRMTRNQAYGKVSVRQYYAIQEKNARTEYVNGTTQDETCVNSLFAHQGLSPCWYLRRHPERQVRV